MAAGRATQPLDERMAQRYAASLTRPGKSSRDELGFHILAYMNERTGIIHLCREAQVSVCGKQSGQRHHGNKLRLKPPNEWTYMNFVLPDQFQLVCTRCARRVWRQRQAILAEQHKIG